MHYVYVLEFYARGWYIGYSSDLRRRVAEHLRHKNISTASRGSFKLIYYEAYLDKEDALGRERFLKSGSGHRFLKKQLVHYHAVTKNISLNKS